MIQRQNVAGSKNKLRSRAEATIRKQPAEDPSGLPHLSPNEAQHVIHELQVHQVELEMQNDELLRIQAELETARAHYFDLYHLAPIGYCILSKEGLILEANLTAVSMLGLALSTLVKKPISRFILKDDQDIYYLHRKMLYSTNRSIACELRMVKKDGTPFWVQLTSAPPDLRPTCDREPACRLVMSDITERKTLEAENARLQDQLRQAGHHPLKP